MTASGRDADVDVHPYVVEIATRMNERVTQISAILRHNLEDEIPELHGDPRTIDLLGASVEGNVDTVLHALRHDIPVARILAPAAAIEYARRLAQHGIPLTALIRAYRVGQRRMTDLVFAELREVGIPPEDRVTVMETITGILFEYIDSITEQVAAIYEREREQWLESQNSIRAVRVREVLAGRKPVDVDAATESIRYPLRWHHLALVMWYADSADDSDERDQLLTRLQRFVRELAEAVGTGAGPLFVAADRGSGWAWLPYRSAHPEAIAAIRAFAGSRPGGPHLAIGEQAAGIAGFRRSHQQAQAARSVAVTSGLAAQRIITAGDPGVAAAALLGGTIAAAREWVGETLGDLAADNDNDARLRETLRVFLGAGSSYKAAAAELDLHFNSVKYRVGRAISRRGRPLAEDRLDVEIALLLCHCYGSAVLRAESS
ncbi:PucR family transcriptional regulator [Nocardia sp. KC 131]|uniref:PucR family transcriptional regulator n=1 Tax=Nocardia arseniciresistens TaxID=3392119 RepID=UPI00398F21C2